GHPDRGATGAGRRANGQTPAPPTWPSLASVQYRWRDRKRVWTGAACATIISVVSASGPMPPTPRVRIEKGGRVAVLWIENPPRNTMRLSMVTDLMSRVPELKKDDSIRAVVVAGAGSLVFSSGMGIGEWSKIVGRSNALELLLSGKALTALDALRLGIVDHLSAPGEALSEARSLAELFAKKSRSAVKAIKRALTEGDEKPYRNRFLLESQHAVQLLWSEEYQEAMAKLRKKA